MSKCDTNVHASNLCADDIRLKNTTRLSTICLLCDSHEVEDDKNFVLRCPVFYQDCNTMFGEINRIEDGSGTCFLGSSCDTLFVILAKRVMVF